jgi:hypothetical protein
MDFDETGWYSMGQIHLFQHLLMSSYKNSKRPSRCTKDGQVLDYQLLMDESATESLSQMSGRNYGRK